MLREKSPPGRDSYYYNEEINKIPDQELGESRPHRRKKPFYIQDRRLLTEKYFPKEKFVEDYYDETFYGDLEPAYSEPVKAVVQPSLETRQFTSQGSVLSTQYSTTRVSTFCTFFGIWGSSTKNNGYWDDIRRSIFKI